MTRVTLVPNSPVAGSTQPAATHTGTLNESVIAAHRILAIEFRRRSRVVLENRQTIWWWRAHVLCLQRTSDERPVK